MDLVSAGDVCLTVGEGREGGRQVGASPALLELLEDLEEALPAFGHAAVDLRVGPARDLADLGVRVALGLQGQGLDLLRLQRPQRLAAPRHPLAAGGAVVGFGAVGGDRVERVAVLLAGGRPRRAQQALALSPDTERLALGHRLHPAHEVVALDRRRLGQQDLERALISVLGVVSADRVAAGGPPEDGVVALDQAGCRTLARLRGALDRLL